MNPRLSTRSLIVTLLLASGVVSVTFGAGTPALKAAPAASPPPAAAHAESDAIDAKAESLLSRLGSTYAGFSSYDIGGVSHMEMAFAGQVQTVDVPFTLVAMKPSRLHNEVMNPQLSVITISDGASTWTYVPQAHQYTHTGKPPAAASSSPTDIATALASGTPIQRYVSPLEGLEAARLVGSATVVVDGRPRACTVVSARFTTPSDQPVTLSPITVWIDDSTRVVRDSVEVVMAHAAPDGGPVTIHTVTTFRPARVNTPMPDSLFRFTPPKDAQLVDQIVPGHANAPPSPLVGKPAEEITLDDLAGKTHTLSALKGKVVLIDFWATWCGPCRLELPSIVKLHQELTPKGLRVVAVNVGETKNVVSGFLQQAHYDLPVWLDVTRKVAATYGANAIPTLVVIDRQGVVSSLAIGLHDEASLRAMLKKAGLD